MIFRSQHDLIDPDVPPPESDLHLEETGESETFEDTYVIGEGGNSIQPAIIITSDKPRSRPKPWAKPAAFVLFAAFIGLTAWNMSRVLQGPPQRPVPSPFQMKQALYLGVMKVDAYRRAHGTTPTSIKDLDLPADVYDYTRIDSELYTLAFRTDGQKLEYSSRIPKETVFGPSQAILSMGESQ